MCLVSDGARPSVSCLTHYSFVRSFASRGRERFSGGFNRVQVAGTDQALVAEDEALRAGVAEASAAQVLAPGVWSKGRGWGGLGLGSGSGLCRKYY